jgi:hypothetical protein
MSDSSSGGFAMVLHRIEDPSTSACSLQARPARRRELSPTGNHRAVSDDASCGTLYAGCGAGQALQVAAAEDGTVRCTPATQPWMCRAWSAQTPRQPAEPGPPRVPSAAAAEDRLRAHQARAERRPSALPPRPPASPSPGSPPARARSTSAATRPPATRTPPATSSAARRSCAAPLLFAGPPSSMARLSRFKQKLAGECCWSTPLPQASCAAGELICRRAGRGASSGPEKLRPEEAADGREPKAGGEGEEDQGSRRGRGCGAGMRCYQQVNNVWGVYNTSCPPGAPPELPSSTRQSLPAIIDCLWPAGPV